MTGEIKLNSEVTSAHTRISLWVNKIKTATADKRTADSLVDAESLGRAADLELIYNDMSWVQDMPKPKRGPRGRRVNPKSREQFAKWVRQRYEWGSHQRLSQLHQAYNLVPILATRVAGIDPATEKQLRPFAKMRQQGYDEFQPQVWEHAVDLADGETPNERIVRKAVNDFLLEHQAPTKNTARDPRTENEIERARRKKLLADFVAITEQNNRSAGQLLDQMLDYWNHHQDELREEQHA
jgi:hypothetical protein